jgi:5-methylcytosine-specific restriction endonuclease McrA
VILKGSQIKPPPWPRCSRCRRPIKPDVEAPEGYCSLSCHEAEGEEYSQAKLRELVFERDKGVCADCGLDAIALRVELDGIVREAARTHGLLNAFEARVHQLVRLGFPRGPIERGESLWQAAHVKARVENGPNDPKNCVTLCLGCHAKDTKALSKKRAASRKPRGRFGRG